MNTTKYKSKKELLNEVNGEISTIQFIGILLIALPIVLIGYLAFAGMVLAINPIL